MTTEEQKIIEFQKAAPATRRSAFVTNDQWVIWELPDGTLGEGTEDAFRGARDSLPEEDRDQISAIWTPTEMGARHRSAVMDATIRLGQDMQDDGTEGVTRASMDMTFHQGAYQMALLRHNIRQWRGPIFRDHNGGPLPVTHANIDRLNIYDPLLQRTIASISRRNPFGGRQDPKSSKSAGSASSTAS